jgi:Uma2 family endonuclease
MTYYDGTLEIMSPEYIHDGPSRRLGLLVPLVCERLGFTYNGTGSTTFLLPGEARREGAGREPDQGFYIASEPLIRGKEEFDLRVDPPPDLWIEVDNRSSSRLRLPVYARLGVPEVWRLDSRKNRLWFGRKAGEAYEAIERSIALPVLTPALVLEALALGVRTSEWEWKQRLVAWLGNLPAGGHGGERGA